MQQRKLLFYKDKFQKFLGEQDSATQDKIMHTLSWVIELDIIPVSVMRSIKGYRGLFEIRVEYNSNIYRIFNCFDDGNLVVLFNGFQKKTQKTPKREIDKANKLMKEYFNEKGGQTNGKQER